MELVRRGWVFGRAEPMILGEGFQIGREVLRGWGSCGETVTDVLSYNSTRFYIATDLMVPPSRALSLCDSTKSHIWGLCGARVMIRVLLV